MWAVMKWLCNYMEIELLEFPCTSVPFLLHCLPSHLIPSYPAPSSHSLPVFFLCLPLSSFPWSLLLLHHPAPTCPVPSAPSSPFLPHSFSSPSLTPPPSLTAPSFLILPQHFSSKRLSMNCRGCQKDLWGCYRVWRVCYKERLDWQGLYFLECRS